VPRRVKAGDTFALALENGEVLLQAIARHPSHGWAVRVIDVAAQDLTQDLSWVASANEKYVVLVGDVAQEERLGHVRRVGNASLPERFDGGRLPTFRASASFIAGRRHEPGSWWLDDGEREWRVGELTEEQQHLPDRILFNVLGLKEYIEHGWDPEWEFKGPGAAEFAVPRKATAKTNRKKSSFFLIFPTEDDAKSASADLSRDSRIESVAVDAYVEGRNRQWVVVAKTEDVKDLDDLALFDTMMERIASSHHGDYDGNEVPLPLGGD